jgi:high-affinity iron transporter
LSVRALPIALVVALAALALLPAGATAQDVSADEALDEIAIARDLSDQAVDAAAEGDRERGYELAREAYLEHFELVEIPLRLRDPNLVLDLEFDFAELRDGIRDGAPMSDVRDTERTIQAGLDDVERALTDEGFAAPAVAFGFSFSILFREGLEATLLIAILLTSLEAARASNYRRPLAWGAVGAIAATAATFALTLTVIEIAPLNRELLEAVAALLAVAVLFVVTFWLKLPVKPLLIGGAAILLLLSVAFAGNAVRSLQEVDIIGATPIEGEWARLPIFLAELTGIHPTVEGIAVQIGMLVVYGLGALYVFAIRPARERRAGSPAEETA